MPTNPYINNFGSSPEQSLVQDLVIESIKFYGIDVNWIPRITSANADSILNEDVNESYSYNREIEVYIKNIEGFEGHGDEIIVADKTNYID